MKGRRSSGGPESTGGGRSAGGVNGGVRADTKRKRHPAGGGPGDARTQSAGADRPSSGRPGSGRDGRQPSGDAAGRANPGGRGSSAEGAAGRRGVRTARSVALDTLVKVAEAGAYSNLQLNKALQDAQLSRQDAALATELVYGTIQRQRTLDYRLAALVSKGLDTLAPWVHQLLRLSAYQLLYLDRIPAHAAVNEAVQLAKRRGHAGISGMVNGVLRNMERRLVELKAPAAESDPAMRIGLTHSYPDWLVRRWIRQFGIETAEAICAAGNEPPHASVRVNRLRMTRDEAIAALAAAGIAARESPVAPAAVIAEGAGNLAQTEGFAKGDWTMQDESSMLVAEICAPAPGMRVLDCCSAPGGKATHLGELMGDRGGIVANDVHPHKLKLIEDNARRLGLRSIDAVAGDALALAGRFEPGSFDLVLLDAPCSGLGVIRRKPEIKWTKTEGDIRDIAALQSRLLDEAARMVKPGGILVYSTCTIEREENGGQIRSFLERNRGFRADVNWPQPVLEPLRERGVIGEGFDGTAQLLPHHFGSDGFYIARMKRED
ncbi:16S rRNA (cytosine(967)-C(5))-methyltransferase RsmB [Paenibacillus humicola]|uniref:16S rRNA (cytosine(967)-C(5))-methyltransferase RsmB n=1 Tax=Paenibacillus humicola TaxID=3110540 RepID=UPI00237AAF8C|nr:16S rRNA (cytosine(967)-C(5))-methyltransferase RsmB [Paenibacillus humicola]